MYAAKQVRYTRIEVAYVATSFNARWLFNATKFRKRLLLKVVIEIYSVIDSNVGQDCLFLAADSSATPARQCNVLTGLLYLFTCRYNKWLSVRTTQENNRKGNVY